MSLEQDLLKQRLQRIQEIEALGFRAYGQRFEFTHTLPQIRAEYDAKTAEELAEMIRQDLSKMSGCPKRGIEVTVYGLNPWNSMLKFGVEAGPVPNKQELLRFFHIISERLKRLYDIRD